MPVKTKEKPKTKVVTKKETSKELMEKTICNLTDIVAKLKNDTEILKTDVQRLKIRIGIWVSKVQKK